jgi:segregation and condensation protein A
MLETRVGDDVFIVELERFQGPMDLLLHLIREQDLDIFDIPIARITAQFLAAIDGVEYLGLDRAGEFLEMAATLVRIKAQMLLPRRVDDLGEMEDPRAGLVRRLLEYELYREVARRLVVAESERSRHFARGFVPPAPRPAEPPPLELCLEDFLDSALAVGQRALPPPDHRVRGRMVPIEDKIALIMDLLSRSSRIEFRRLVADHDRTHGVATLLAGLELARQHELAMRQREPFAALWLYRRKHRSDENGSDSRGAAVRE